MIYFNIAVLSAWILIWTMWFFCIPGSKWFDKQMQEIIDDDFPGYAYLIMGTIMASLGGAISIYKILGNEADVVLFAILSMLTITSVGMLLVSYARFAMVDIHNNLRDKRNY